MLPNNIKNTGRYLFFKLIKYKQYSILTFIYYRLIIKTNSNIKSSDDCINILALTSEKFRGDLEVLNRNPNINVYIIPYVWQRRLFSYFYKGNVQTKYYQPYNYPEISRKKVCCENFLFELQKRLYKKLKIDCVIGSNVRYIDDVEWGVVSMQLGIPYVVLYRECLVLSKTIYNIILERLKLWGRFPGSHIIVHNEIMKKLLLESEFIDEDRVSVLGCMRMDPFINRVIAGQIEIPKRKRIIFFSFIHTQTSTQYPYSLFKDTHLAIMLAAKNNPDVDFIIKPKAEVYKKSCWKECYERACEEESIDTNSISNLYLMPDGDAQELIYGATAVVGINSTTILEAGLAGVPVIIPYFNEIRGEKYLNRIYMLDKFEFYDTPSNKEELIYYIEKYISGCEVDSAVYEERKKIFNEYVSNIDGTSTVKYINKIKSEIDKQKTLCSNIEEN